ncbi:MAG TPA: YciI family protein [Gemmatimonadaceae bacterium]|nr:YciI family protein [Gemmatimonadaceae bacterium]
MRFMMIVHGPEDFGKAGPPPQALMDAIGKLGEEAFKAGTMVSMGGLRPTAQGARIRQKGGKLVTTDGPFTEAKEVIGGFSIMELPSREAAMAEAQKFMELHRKYWPQWEGECEVRQMYDEGEQPDF